MTDDENKPDNRPSKKVHQLAIAALVCGSLCSLLAVRSLVLQTWLIWYELGLALLSGYVAIVAGGMALLRDRFRQKGISAMAALGVVAALPPLNFFHVMYTPDLYFDFSESQIWKTEVVLLCKINRSDGRVSYEVEAVWRNRLPGASFRIGDPVPSRDPSADEFMAQPNTGDQMIFFVKRTDEGKLSVIRTMQVFDGKVGSVEDTRLDHLKEIDKFKDFVKDR